MANQAALTIPADGIKMAADAFGDSSDPPRWSRWSPNRLPRCRIRQCRVLAADRGLQRRPRRHRWAPRSV